MKPIVLNLLDINVVLTPEFEDGLFNLNLQYDSNDLKKIGISQESFEEKIENEINRMTGK